MLTTGTDIIPAEGQDNSGDDTITGVAATLSAVRTLNVEDQIDGGAGTDTLKVDMQAAFAGFTTDKGFLKNVEVVELTNAGANARLFDASGATGVEQYILNGAVNLDDIDVATVQVVANARTANLDVGFASKVLDGSADALDLTVNNVGALKTTDAAEVAVTVTTDTGFETLALTATGTNVVDLSGVDAPAVTVAGAGALKVTAVNTALETVDASTATGAIDIDLTGATASSVKTGSADDIIRADTGDLTTNAVLNGGAGADTLELSSAAAAGTTVQFQMNAIETVKLASAGLGGALVFSGAKSTGITTIDAEDDIGANATFVGMGAGDATINLIGDNSAAGGDTVSADMSGAVTVNVVATEDATADATESNNNNVTVGKAASVELFVNQFQDYAGTLTAAKAESVVVEATGSLTTGATIAAAEATTATITTTNKSLASSATLTAAALTELTVTAAGDLDLKGSTLTDLQSLTVSANGFFDLSGVALGALNTATLSGTGSVELGNLGDADLTDYGITLTASGLKSDETTNAASLEVGTIDTEGTTVNVNASAVVGGVRLGVITTGNGATAGGAVTVNVAEVGGAVTLGVIDASGTTTDGNVTIDASAVTGAVTFAAVTGKNVTIDASGVLGAVTWGGAITASGTVNFTGAELDENDITIGLDGTAQTLTLTGGIEGDNITINNATTTTSVIVKGDLGAIAASDDLTIDFTNAVQAAAYTLDLTGIKNYEAADVKLSGVKDGTIKLGSGADVDTLIYSAAQKLTVTGFKQANDIINVKALGTVVAEVAVAAGGTVADAADTVTAYIFADGATASGGKTIASYTDLVDVLAFLNAALTIESGDVDGVAVINDLANKKAYIYTMDVDTFGDTSIDAIALVGVISTDAALTTANIDF